MATSTAPVRRAIVTLTIGSFSVAALLGVVALLAGGDFGETETRILLTTLLVGVMSVGVLCFLLTAGTPYQLVGVTGGVVALVPFVTGLVLIWRTGSGDAAEVVWRSFGVGAIVASTLAQVCLLLVLAARKGRLLRVLVMLTVTAASVLAAIFSAVVLGAEPDDSVGRFIGVVAILDALGTVVVAALAKFGPEHETHEAREGGVGRPPSLTVPVALFDALDARAAATGRTRDEVAVEALETYLRSPVQ